MWKYVYMLISRIQRFLRRGKQSLTDTHGVSVVEVILILVVLIGLVIIFKSQLTSLVNTIFQKITSESSSI
jgi:Flp pilus assembly pilin Flp